VLYQTLNALNQLIKATNQKLIDRSVRIIQEICAITYDEAMALYQVSDLNPS
jgi:N-acetylmuramic acid 6-phosphate etherase